MAMDANDREKIQEKIEKAKLTTANLVEGISSLNASLAAFRERCFQTMSDIRSAADLIVNEVRVHEEKLIAKVQNVIDLKEEYVQQEKKNLEDNISELQQSIDYTTDVLNSSSQDEINLDEWKNALVLQLDNLSNVKQSFGWENTMDNDGKFLFIYANEELLKSVTCYGAIVEEVPDDFKFNQQDDADMPGYDKNLEVNVIPVLTLNGAVFDVDAAINDDDDEESTDDESDSYDDSDSHGDSDDARDDDKDSDDDNNNDDVDNDDSDDDDDTKVSDDADDKNPDDDDDDDDTNVEKNVSSTQHDDDDGSGDGDDEDVDGIDVDRHIVNRNLTKTNNLSTKPKLSTLL